MRATTLHSFKQKATGTKIKIKITPVASFSSSSSPLSSQSSPQSQSQFPWLQRFKTKELQSLAQRTGLPSSGTKSVLLGRLESGFAQCREEQAQKQKQDGTSEEIRVLSIDMGIRNLAFAVLGVRGLAEDLDPGGLLDGLGLGYHIPLGEGTGKEKEEEKEKRRKNKKKGNVELTLRAWRRVSLPLDRGFSSDEFARYLDGGELDPVSPTSPSLVADDVLEGGTEEPSPTNTKGKGKGRAKEEEKEEKAKAKTSFSLEVYATHAHSILTTLLARYQPTHVLIERQRFRSVGGAAVQEWSLRVGVFEGMLWAVLHALRMQQSAQRGASTQAQAQAQAQAHLQEQGPKVIAIAPSKVGKVWASQTTSANPDAESDTISGVETEVKKARKKKKSTTSSREGKKLKIDLVGSWLENDAFVLSERDGTREWVDGYMAKWKKATRSSKTKSTSRFKSKKTQDSETKAKEVALDMTKLDDLADCLVQGVTWLEWERTKGRVVRDGAESARVIVGIDDP